MAAGGGVGGGCGPGGRSPALLVQVANRGTDRAASEAALAALICRVADDGLAALTVLHMLLPAAKGMAGRLWIAGNASERALAVIEALWERIESYPWQRRGGSVSGNVLADVAGVLIRAGRPSSVAVSVWLDEEPGWEERMEVRSTGKGMAAGEELLALLAEAVRAGELDQSAAALIGECRVASGARGGDRGPHGGRRPERPPPPAAGRVPAGGRGSLKKYLPDLSRSRP